MPTDHSRSRRESLLALALFLILTLGGGMLIGFFTAPGPWYAGLAKPPFNPPNWVFGPVWATLYVLIGLAGWLIRRDGDRRLMHMWWAQLVLNFLWSPVFFAAHLVGPGLIVILALLAVILALIGRAWGRNRIVAALFLPYAAWVAFASALNGAILILN